MPAMRWFALVLFFALGPCLSASGVKVAALHPLLGDLARQIGGERVEVVDLLQPTGNLHHFEPTTQEMAAATGAQLVLATGKNMEPYLPRLGDALPAGARLLELGDVIPDVPVPAEGEERKPGGGHEHGHDHGDACCGHGPNDPHWWQTPSNMKRAGRRLAAELAAIDPDHAADYRARSKEWNRKMDALDADARARLAAIPEDRRILVTGHASMCHFCEAYGFTPIAAQGISMQDEGNAASLAALMARLRASGAGALFTEINASPKMLDTIAHELGVPTYPLITDGLHPDYRDFASVFRYNVETIARALTPHDE